MKIGAEDEALSAERTRATKLKEKKKVQNNAEKDKRLYVRKFKSDSEDSVAKLRELAEQYGTLTDSGAHRGEDNNTFAWVQYVNASPRPDSYSYLGRFWDLGLRWR